MTQQSLARMERVALSEVWPDEAKDFTPWLANHIEGLEDALGLEVKVKQTEARYGDFKVDILATDVDDRYKIIIENQLKSTNHDHMGKLLTYAAGFDAKVVVWLAQEFRDEHRQTLNWLNQRTGEDTRFFGVVVELWKIDNSQPAPCFNLVAKPKDWQRLELRRKQKMHRDFRIGLEKRLRCAGLLPGLYDHSGPWMCIAETEGRSYEIDFDDEIMFSIGLQPATYKLLERDKDAIQDKLGELEWHLAWEGEAKMESYIMGSCPGKLSELSTDSWGKVYDGVVDKYRKFLDTFEPRLKSVA